ncbi:MAG: phosphoribosylformylglycinamidine cyclo-ligase [Pasteurella sp.]|nr:phosphoribosylformylglycinamidine cyclo-ligase [Pasteurella sp.]
MLTYKQSGVDKEEGYRAVALMKKKVKQTHNANVLTNLGSFGALYQLGEYKNPILVSGTDGVGTKLKIAFQQQRYDSVGIDCVAMCVNDVLCHGAKPLFFLDYLACGKLDSAVAAELVSGVSEGCLQSDAALIGGETAEMPGFYSNGEYDIAGFCVGIVEKEHLIDGSKVKAGDVIIGLASSGFHSNGFSLLRQIFNDANETFLGKNIAETLLTPTRIYVKPVLKALQKFPIHGLAHITGGGLIENLPRAMNKLLSPVIMQNSWEIPPLMKEAKERAKLSNDEFFGVFNAGIGFCVIANARLANEIVSFFQSEGEQAFIIGEVAHGDNRLYFK